MQDIGKLKDNYEYYEGFEGEEEVMLSLKENLECNIHVWEGYFSDIFDDPPLHGLGWHGFTRDYQECRNAFGIASNNAEILNLREYLEDMMQYKDKKFRFEETREVFELIADFLKYAIDTKQTVIVKVW